MVYCAPTQSTLAVNDENKMETKWHIYGHQQINFAVLITTLSHLYYGHI